MWKINGTDITESFGVSLLKGAYDRLFEMPQAKPYLTEETRETDGETQYVDNPRVQARDISLPCIMKAGSITELWRRRDALLSHVKGRCELELCRHNRFYQLIFRSTEGWSRISRLGDGSVYARFSILFREADPSDVREADRLVAEDGSPVITENGDGIIAMKIIN